MPTLLDNLAEIGWSYNRYFITHFSMTIITIAYFLKVVWFYKNKFGHQLALPSIFLSAEIHLIQMSHLENYWPSVLGCRSQNCRARKAIRGYSWSHCRTSWWNYRQNRNRRKCKSSFFSSRTSFWDTMKQALISNRIQNQSRIAVNYSQFIFTLICIYTI